MEGYVENSVSSNVCSICILQYKDLMFYNSFEQLSWAINSYFCVLTGAETTLAN